MDRIPFAVLNAAGEVVNIVLWDGETAWEPPDGCHAVADPGRLYAFRAVELDADSTQSETHQQS